MDSIQVTLPDGANLQLEIETTVDWGETWYSLSALWQVAPLKSSVMLTIEETGHRDINKMFVDVSNFIKDLESGRKRLILEDNSQLAIVGG